MKHILIALILSCFAMTVFGQKEKSLLNKAELELIKREYDFLKQQQEKQYNYIKEQHKELSAKFEALEQSKAEIIKELKAERKAHQDFVEDIYSTISAYTISVVFIVGGLLSWFGWNRFNQIKQDADRFVSDKISNQMTNLFEDKKTIIEDLLKKYDKHAQIKEETRILVVEDGSGIKFSKELKRLGYKNVKSKTNISDIYSIAENGSFNTNNIEEHDLVFFNIINDDRDVKEGDNFIKDGFIKAFDEKKLFFFKSYILEDKFYTNVGGAQMPSQVAGNLMNLLDTAN